MKFNKSFISLFLLFIFMPSVFSFNWNPWSEPVNEILITDDYSTPSTHTSFIVGTTIENDDSFNLLAFINIDTSFGVLQYNVVRSAGIYEYLGNGFSVSTGIKCNRNEAVRFTYCDNKNSKSSCKKDIFDNMWQVKSSSDFMNFADFYTSNTDGFYYTYSCYDIGATDRFETEKAYLYQNKCTDYDGSNGKGIDYKTELLCLDKLKKIEENKNSKSCDYKLLSETACVGDRVYQLERQSDCSEEFTKNVKFCYNGCGEGSCKAESIQSCDLKPKGYVCKGNVLYQEIQTTACIDELDFVKVCDNSCSDGACSEKPIQTVGGDDEDGETEGDDEPFCFFNCDENEPLETTELLTCNLCLNGGAIQKTQFNVTIGTTCASKLMAEVTDFTYVQACSDGYTESQQRTNKCWIENPKSLQDYTNVTYDISKVTLDEACEAEGLFSTATIEGLGFFGTIWNWIKSLFGGN